MIGSRPTIRGRSRRSGTSRRTRDTAVHCRSESTLGSRSRDRSGASGRDRSDPNICFGGALRSVALASNHPDPIPPRHVDCERGGGVLRPPDCGQLKDPTPARCRAAADRIGTRLGRPRQHHKRSVAAHRQINSSRLRVLPRSRAMGGSDFRRVPMPDRVSTLAELHPRRRLRPTPRWVRWSMSARDSWTTPSSRGSTRAM